MFEDNIDLDELFEEEEDFEEIDEDDLELVEEDDGLDELSREFVDKLVDTCWV
jgi:hypothetical protein